MNTVKLGDITLIHGDCLEVMKDMPDKSVDMVFADPPFNVGKPYGGSKNNDLRDDYYDWCNNWITRCWRIIKPTGSFYLMTLDKHLEKLFPMMSVGKFVNLIKWRNVAANHSKRQYWISTQPILFYGKTDEYIFNTYGETRKIKRENLRWGGYTTGPKGTLLDYWDDIPFVYAGSIRHKEAIMEGNTNRKAHPCQMPTGLPVRTILFSTNEGDTILDPFMGSGTTLVACARLGRKGIGIELDKGYFDIAVKRVEDEQRQMKLF